MNKPTSDNTKLPESMKQACCNICTLAEAMKDCKNCPFNKYAKAVTKQPIRRPDIKEIRQDEYTRRK